jgi:transcription elongation GreA/GreB family factor
MNERNKSICESIERGEIPMLSFELDMAKKSFEALIKKQENATERLAEAMGQSAETWHDNAPADAVVEESRLTTALADSLIDTINSAEVYKLDRSSDEVTLGSIVTIKFGNSESVSQIILLGRPNAELQEIFKVKGCKAVGIDSPLGRAIVSAKVGDEIEYTIGKNTNRVKILVLQ